MEFFRLISGLPPSWIEQQLHFPLSKVSRWSNWRWHLRSKTGTIWCLHNLYSLTIFRESVYFWELHISQTAWALSAKCSKPFRTLSNIARSNAGQFLTYLILTYMISIVVDKLFYTVLYNAGHQLCCQNYFCVFLRSYKYTFTKLLCVSAKHSLCWLIWVKKKIASENEALHLWHGVTRYLFSFPIFFSEIFLYICHSLKYTQIQIF